MGGNHRIDGRFFGGEFAEGFVFRREGFDVAILFNDITA
jgi:hypothetical protein